MKELLENAALMCQDIYKKNLALKIRITDDTPLESLPVYQKFRGLSFRMKELFGLLKIQIKEDLMLSSDYQVSPGYLAFCDIMQTYVLIRNNVILSVLKDATSSALFGNSYNNNNNHHALNNSSDKSFNTSNHSNSGGMNGSGSGTGTGSGSSGHNLCYGIRQAYSVLLRTSQLELQLYESLFKVYNLYIKYYITSRLISIMFNILI